MKNQKTNSEIDLLEVFLTIINNKLKIALIVALSIAVGYGIKISRVNDGEIKITTFTTKFESVSILDQNLNYIDNNLDIDSKNVNLNRFTLFDLFTDILTGEINQLVKDFNFIKKEDYENEKAFEDSLEAITSSIDIALKREESEDPTFGFIKFTTRHNVVANQWNDFIKTLEYKVNKKSQKYLKDMISSKIKVAKLVKENQIEDVQNKIRTTLKYHELEMKARLSFLREQAKIAREGNVESEKVTSSSFGSNYSINYSEDGLLSLYYLKGYRVIEKEIELIKKRKNSYLFAKNIPNLEARKLEIQTDQTLNRVENKFKETPIFNNNKIFIAGKVGRTTSKTQTFNRVTSTSTTIIFASLIGLIIAIFYIFLSRSIHKRSKA